jgi:DNA-binding transcriptional LysR family regulator
VQLTDFGIKLVPRAQQILQHIEDTRRELLSASERIAGPLSLAISHHIGLHRLPPVLKAFTTTYPDVQLNIQFTDSEAAYQEIQRGQIELAVITLAPYDAPQIIAQKLWSDPLHFVAAPDHSLANKPRISLKALAEETAILPGMNTYTGQIVKSLFSKKQLDLTLAMDTNYLETIKMMASIGLGWSVLPETMIDSQLKQLDVQTPGLQRELGVIAHHNRQLSNAARAFIDTLHQYAGE